MVPVLSSLRNRQCRELQKLLLDKCGFLILENYDSLLTLPMRERLISKIYLIHNLKILFYTILNH